MSTRAAQTSPLIPALTPITPTQIDPTSLIFQGRAYDIRIDPNALQARYFFVGKRGARYTLIPLPEQRVRGCPVLSIMQHRRGGALATYRLTPEGFLIELKRIR